MNNKNYKSKKYENMSDERATQYFNNYFAYILGKQEYSVKELRDKAYQKVPDKIDIAEEVLEKFIEKKYVSDERYAEINTRSKYNSG